MKKFLAFGLALVMSISILSGCSPEKSSETNGKSENKEEQKSETGQSQEQEKPKEATVVWYFSDSGVQFEEDNYVVKRIKEELNINFVHLAPSTNDYEQQLNLKLAAGEQVDVINVYGTLKKRLVDSGLLLDIDKYLTEEYIPNVMRISNNWDKALDLVKYPNGKTYTVPDTNNTGMTTSYYIRNDWLKNLNLQVPTTLDELKDVLVKFTTMDPDKNNKNDTWGTVINGIWGSFCYGLNFGAQRGAYYKTDDGQATYYMFHPNIKNWVNYIKDLIDTGACNPEIQTTKFGQVTEMIKAGQVGFYAGWNDSNFVDDMKKLQPDAEWVIMPAPKGIYDQGYYNAGGILREEIGITRMCKDVESVLRLMNYLADDKSDENNVDFSGSYYEMRYGERGVNWDVFDGVLETGQTNKTIEETNKSEKWVGKGRFRSKFDITWMKNGTPEQQELLQKHLSYKTINDIPASDPAAPISEEGLVLPGDTNKFMVDFDKQFQVYFAKAIYGKVGVDEGFEEFIAEAEEAGLKEHNATISQLLKDMGRLK